MQMRSTERGCLAGSGSGSSDVIGLCLGWVAWDCRLSCKTPARHHRLASRESSMRQHWHIGANALRHSHVQLCRNRTLARLQAGTDLSPRVRRSGCAIGLTPPPCAVHMRADGCGRDDPALCFDRAGAQQNFPVVAPGFDRERRRHQDDIGSSAPQCQKKFRKSQVVTDRQAQGQRTSREWSRTGYDRIAGAETGCFRDSRGQTASPHRKGGFSGNAPVPRRPGPNTRVVLNSVSPARSPIDPPCRVMPSRRAISLRER